MPKSKPFMVSDIATRTVNAFKRVFLSQSYSSHDIRDYLSRELKRSGPTFSPIILRMLGINVLALMMLALGLIYLGQYHASLVQAELETLYVQGQLFSGTVTDNTIKDRGRDVLSPDAARKVRRLSEALDIRTRLYNENGILMADSHQFQGPDGGVQVQSLPPPSVKRGFWYELRDEMLGFLDKVPRQTAYPTYPGTKSGRAQAYPDAREALSGTMSATAWQEKETGRVVLSVAVPLIKNDQILGALMLTKSDNDINRSVRGVRSDILRIFLTAFAVTMLLSFYLAGSIAYPIKKLSDSVRELRQTKGTADDIPDYTERNDEIGELSSALREMTQALSDRIDSIERFAADVAHEIKNPLTSLRSAVETAHKIKDEKKRQQLMEIILHDVDRLDRLISDISNASRLDAELSREEMALVDMRNVLQFVYDMHMDPMNRLGGEGRETKDGRAIVLDIPTNALFILRGNEGRLIQVFQNVIGNALSFSPENGTVKVKARHEGHKISVTVEDEGTGIPDNKLETIFDRFYTERPEGERYGSHSGLGLSISKQIIESHKGQIRAENMKDDKGKIIGASFIIELPAIQ